MDHNLSLSLSVEEEKRRIKFQRVFKCQKKKKIKMKIQSHPSVYFACIQLIFVSYIRALLDFYIRSIRLIYDLVGEMFSKQ